MRCSTKYVGLDVHQATTLSVVRDGNGRIITQSILPTEEAALLEFAAGMRGAVHGDAITDHLRLPRCLPSGLRPHQRGRERHWKKP